MSKSPIKDRLGNQLAAKAATCVQVYRKQRGMRQVDLAGKVDFSHRHLQKIESGEVDISLSTLHALSKSLDVPACFLVNEVYEGCFPKSPLGCPYEILDLLPLGILISDSRGLIVYGNNRGEQIFRSHGALSSKEHYFWEFLTESDDIENFKKMISTSHSNVDKPTSLYAKVNDAKGGLVPIRIDIAPFKGKFHESHGYLYTVTSHPSW